MRAYAGIGSRETPEDVLLLMSQTAKKLAWQGWTLRSGGAPGADQAFQIGAATAATNPLAKLVTNGRPDPVPPEIYLPWPGFESEFQRSLLHLHGETFIRRSDPQTEAFAIAAEFHPAWSRLSHGGRALYARNVHQILGFDVINPQLSSFVICWTKGGKGGGGMGQAIRIATEHDVPIFDFAIDEDRERIVGGLLEAV